MLLTLLQFFATKFLFLALHLKAGSFPRPLSPQEEIRTFAALRELSEGVIEKLKLLTDAEFAELEFPPD